MDTADGLRMLRPTPFLPREGVLAVRGARQSVERAPPTPIDPARLARRGFAFDFAEVALDESDYLGVPCGDVDLVLHE